MGRRVMLSIVTMVVASHAAVANSSANLVPFSGTQEGCTIGVANGLVATDGRPILWKVRDLTGEPARQQRVHVAGLPYNCIGVCRNGEEICMGFNGAGAADPPTYPAIVDPDAYEHGS